MSTDNKKIKQFSLRPIDAERLVVIKEHTDALFSINVSMLVNDRFGYQVTEFTQFRLAPDLKSIQIWENVPENPAGGAQSPGIVTG